MCAGPGTWGSAHARQALCSWATSPELQVFICLFVFNIFWKVAFVFLAFILTSALKTNQYSMFCVQGSMFQDYSLLLNEKNNQIFGFWERTSLCKWVWIGTQWLVPPGLDRVIFLCVHPNFWILGMYHHVRRLAARWKFLFCLFVLIQFCCRSLPDFEYCQAGPELCLPSWPRTYLVDSQSYSWTCLIGRPSWLWTHCVHQAGLELTVCTKSTLNLLGTPSWSGTSYTSRPSWLWTCDVSHAFVLWLLEL